MSQVNFIVVIPARFDSERPYGKALLNLNEVIGYYAAAATMSNATFMIFSALPSTLMPIISESISKKK